LVPAVITESPAQLAVVLFLTGLAFGPATVALFETLDVLVPGSGAESLTWVTTAEAAGSATGSALAGVLSSHGSVSAAFGIAAARAGAAALTAILLRRARRCLARSTILRAMRFSVDFLGCKVSHVDAHGIRERLLADGHAEAAKGESADVAVVNGCCVTSQAAAKSRKAAARAARTHS